MAAISNQTNQQPAPVPTAAEIAQLQAQGQHGQALIAALRMCRDAPPLTDATHLDPTTQLMQLFSAYNNSLPHAINHVAEATLNQN